MDYNGKEKLSRLLMIFFFIIAASFVDDVQAAELFRRREGNSSAESSNNTKESYGGLTGMVNKLDTSSCKCVKAFEPCDVEMLEETVVKVEGRACSSQQRYCCQRRIVPMNSTESESDLARPLNTILRDEISNTDIRDDTGESPPKVYIRPSTLGAILTFLTEGFKFLSNLFA